MRKIAKIIAIVVSICLIIGILFFANTFVGNPISKFLVSRASDKYVAEKYEDLDLKKEIGFNFKDGNYYVNLKSTTIKDLYFSLEYSQTGKLKSDLYENNITNGWNVISRLDNDYRDETKIIFESLKNKSVFKNGEHFNASSFLVSKIHVFEFPTLYSDKDSGIDSTKLELDKKYDVKELGKQGGAIDVSVSFADLDISYDRGAEALLQIKDSFNKAEVGFYYISFGVFNSEGNYAYRIENFPYSQIYEEGLAERIKLAHETNPVSHDK